MQSDNGRRAGFTGPKTVIVDSSAELRITNVLNGDIDGFLEEYDAPPFDDEATSRIIKSGLAFGSSYKKYLSNVRMIKSRLVIKRIIDVVGSLVALVMLSPVMLVIGLLIKSEGDGPIIFKQLRRGYRGRLFRAWKFRTMRVDAEVRLYALEESNESAGGVLFKLRHDPRVTRLGLFLRRYSLNHLPQLVNVLLGEMSLVGPKALQLRDSDRLLALDLDAYHRRLQVKPGITGLWQVGGRSEVDYERMVELDLAYVNEWSDNVRYAHT